MSTNSPLSTCGIDFGTTNSTVAIVKNGLPQALDIDPDNNSPHILKSLIYANPQGKVEVGQKAVTSYLWDLEHIESKPPQIINTGRFIKTFGPSTGSGVGPPIFVPEIIEVDDSGRGRLLQSLKSVLTSSNYAGTSLFGKPYTLEELLALLLGQIKTRAERICQKTIDNVVLGRPVRYVGDPTKEQLALTRLTTVARMVGFKNIAFEYEPVGAALSFGIDITSPQKILVFDFGGGTLDVCIMEYPSKKVLAVSGRPIGGDLVDTKLVENKLLNYFGSDVIINHKTHLSRYLLNSISQNWYQISMLKTVKNLNDFEYYFPNSDDRQPVQNLYDLIVNDLGYNFFATVDKAKISLTDNPQANFRFKLPHYQINTTIIRPDFEKYIAPLVEESKICIEESLTTGGLNPNQIDYVILTGGSSKIPLFQQMITNIFGSSKIIKSDPFISVALGLALKADQIYH